MKRLSLLAGLALPWPGPAFAGFVSVSSEDPCSNPSPNRVVVALKQYPDLSRPVRVIFVPMSPMGEALVTWLKRHYAEAKLALEDADLGRAERFVASFPSLDLVDWDIAPILRDLRSLDFVPPSEGGTRIKESDLKVVLGSPDFAKKVRRALESERAASSEAEKEFASRYPEAYSKIAPLVERLDGYIASRARTSEIQAADIRRRRLKSRPPYPDTDLGHAPSPLSVSNSAMALLEAMRMILAAEAKGELSLVDGDRKAYGLALSEAGYAAHNDFCNAVFWRISSGSLGTCVLGSPQDALLKLPPFWVGRSPKSGCSMDFVVEEAWKRFNDASQSPHSD